MVCDYAVWNTLDHQHVSKCRSMLFLSTIPLRIWGWSVLFQMNHNFTFIILRVPQYIIRSFIFFMLSFVLIPQVPLRCGVVVKQRDCTLQHSQHFVVISMCSIPFSLNSQYRFWKLYHICNRAQIASRIKYLYTRTKLLGSFPIFFSTYSAAVVRRVCKVGWVENKVELRFVRNANFYGNCLSFRSAFFCVYLIFLVRGPSDPFCYSTATSHPSHCHYAFNYCNGMRTQVLLEAIPNSYFLNFSFGVNWH